MPERGCSSKVLAVAAGLPQASGTGSEHAADSQECGHSCWARTTAAGLVLTVQAAAYRSGVTHQVVHPAPPLGLPAHTGCQQAAADCWGQGKVWQDI